MNVLDCCQKIVLDDILIKHVQNFVYLGSSIQDSRSMTPEVEHQLATTLNALRGEDVSRHCKLSMLCTKVLLILLYGCNTWNMKHVDYDKFMYSLTSAD